MARAGFPRSQEVATYAERTLMYIERRFITYCALLLATIYYLFGKPETMNFFVLEPAQATTAFYTDR